ncbi:hypothetical protein EW093_13555 [Thiospirochaeta perfilievii]|uniref:POTRA domain-containing protein n=1 Tax=Thiospirochaeta perfilievii TaxID=252967 RepID=A0A5C1QC72_9SPIO|nr:hypothetical protein [Thiospirochaeta perfilievii]QEN05693.1 hypothetical protein EW093_13555 [Thiospirochaeta perfilievii]
MKKLLLILLTFLYGITFLVAENVSYNISDIKYDIKGSTKPYFLEKRLGITKDITFNSIEEIEIYVATLKQSLDNLRIFEDSDVTYSLIGNSVTISIYLDEAWGIIPFGYPKYNSETGGRVAMKLYWYNSLGTLTNTLIQGGVNIGLNSETNELEVLTWDTSLSVDKILILDRFYNISYNQTLERSNKDDYEWSYLKSKLSLSSTFNFIKGYNYSPKISIIAEYDHKPVNSITSDAIINEYKVPLSLSYSHGLGKSSVNWIGNFRDGYSYGISNSISLVQTHTKEIKPTTEFSLSGSYFKTFGDLPISIGSKLISTISVNSELLGLGGNVRGVPSGDLYGTFGIFSNNNVFIRVIKLENIAEAIFSPHLDFGITDYLKPKIGTGADFILYVDKLKSLVARGSISLNLSDFDSGTFDWKEDLEIDITSSLFF